MKKIHNGKKERRKIEVYDQEPPASMLERHLNTCQNGSFSGAKKPTNNQEPNKTSTEKQSENTKKTNHQNKKA